MGTWGNMPYDSDCAADLCDKIDTMPIPQLIDQGLKSDEYEEVRVAAWMLKQIGYNYVYPTGLLGPHLSLAIKKLQEVLDDAEWWDLWANPQLAQDDVNSTLVELKERLGERSVLYERTK